jgi:hypothetical protein
VSGIDRLVLLEHVHGHVGWLAAAALVHPAILLRDPRRRADLSVALATLLVTVVASAGFYLYGDYRERLKQGIFLKAPTIGWLFERKEHLAFGALALAWAGALSYLGARAATEPLRPKLRVLSHRAFVGAAVLSIAVAILGTIVASYRTF